MADANFVIDLILRARDETAAAFASAIGNEEALRALRERSSREAVEQARVYEDTMHRRKATDNELAQGQYDLARSMGEVHQMSSRSVDAQVRLEQASRNYQRTLSDTNSSEAQRVQALDRVQRAQKELTAQIFEHERALNEATTGNEKLEASEARRISAQANAHAINVKNIQQEIERQAQLDRQLQQAHDQQMRQFRDRVATEKSVADTVRALDAETARARKANMDRLAREDKADSDARIARRRAEAAAEKQRAADLVRAQKDLTESTRAYAREVENVARIERQRDAARAHGADDSGVRAIENELNIAKRRLSEFKIEVDAMRNTPVEVGVHADTGNAKRELLDFEAAKLAAGKDITMNVDVDVGAAVAKLEAFDAIKNKVSQTSAWDQYKEAVRGASNQVATFDNFLRGLTSLAIGVFFNQIIVLAGAAAGALTALAGSAIYAGGALAGAFAAGAAQAIPVLGLLGIAVSRITNVWKAAQQQQLLQQQQYAHTAKSAKQVSDATDAIRNASDNVTAAHQRERQAQQGLIDARQKAIRQLQDLILQERQASLAAKGAALDQKDAQEALQKALATGATGDIARARLQLQQANLGVSQAGLQRSRTQQDLATRRSQGVEGSPEVVQAKQQISDAAKASDQASRALERAGRQASVAGDQGLMAAGKLNFMLSQMSGAERRLFTQFSQFIDNVRVQGGKFTEPIINSVTHMVTRVNGALKNPLIANTAASLAGTIGSSMTKVFDHFTSGRNANLFAFFVGEANKNIPKIAKIIEGLGDAFLGIAKAASPALRSLLGYFAQGAKSLGDWAKSARGQKALTDFFKEGVRQFKLWMGLLGSVGKLLLDIINPKIGGGARSGGNLVRDMTHAINELDKAVRSKQGREFLQQFFENSRKALELLKPVLIAIGQQFARLFTPEGLANLKAAATLISQVLLPAFGDFLRAMGLLMQVFAVFLRVPFAPQLLRMVVAAAAFFTIMAKLKTVLTPFTEAMRVGGVLFEGVGLKIFGAGLKLEKFGGLFGKLGLILQRFGALIIERVAPMIGGAVDIMFGPWGIAFIAVAAILLVLQKKFNIFGKAIDGIKIAAHAVITFLKDHWKDILTIMGGPLVLAIRLIITHWDEIKNAFSSGVNAVVGFMRRLPGRIAGFAKDAANTIVDAFTGVGGKIIGGILKGIKDIAGLGKDIANAFIDLLNDALPDKIKMPGPVPDISLPHDPIPHLQKGGAIPGYGGGDIRPAMLEPGEHVFTKDEVRRAGGHGAIYALRRLLGGGGQGGPGGYAVGGEVTGGRTIGSQAASLSINVNADVDGMAHKWRLAWQEMVASTRRNAQAVEARVRDLRVNVEATLGRLDRDSSDRWDSITHNARQAGSDIYNGVKKSYVAMANAVYDGLHYVGTATNKVLRSFEADPVSFSLDKPSTGDGGNRAATGYLGMPGERGGDNIPIWVGRGEAVLNWAHQKMIEPALRAYYGLGLADIFKSSHAFHAGGPSAIGGFAKGGFTGPFGSGSAFTAVANFAKRKFGMTMTAGRTNHSTNTAPQYGGNVSDHSWGGAGDFSNGVDTPQEKAFNAFWKNKLPQAIKQLIFEGKDQLQGFPIADHFDHVHVALQRGLAFDLPRMAKLISRAMRGLSVSDLLAGISGGGAQVDHIDPIKVKGRGPLRGLIAKVLGKARSGANTFLDNQFAKLSPGATNGSGPSEFTKFTGPWVDVMSQIASKMHWSLPDWKWLVGAESGGDPTAVNPSSGAFGLGQFLGGTLREYAPFGAASKNPTQQIKAMAKYIADRYTNPTRAKAFHLANNWYGQGGMVPRFARGGFAGGAMRAADGFFRGSTTRTGVYRAPSLAPAVDDLTGISNEFRTIFFGISEAMRQFRRKGKGLTVATDDLTLITKDGGLLDRINDATATLITNLSTKLQRAAFRMSRAGNVVARLSPDAQATQEINNLRATLQQYQTNLNRVNDVTKRTTAALKSIMPRIRELQDIEKPTKAQEAELKRLTTVRQDLISGQRNLRKRVQDLQANIAQTLADLFQKQMDAFQKSVDTALNRTTSGGLNAAQISVLQRKATALGDADSLGKLTNANIEILRQQQEIVRQAAQRATSRGYTDLAAQYQQQFDDLGAQITEAVATQLQNQIDAVNTAAATSQSNADRLTGFADILDRIGGNSGLLGSVVGAVPGLSGQTASALRQQALAQSGQALTAQRTQLQSLLQSASAQGNLGQVDALTSQLADLDKSIADNIVSQQELTTQIRQSAIDAITARASFQTGVFGNLMSLAQAVAGNTQSQDTLTPGLLQQNRDIISQTLFQLEDKLKDFGIDIGHVTGDELVNSLKNLDFTTIEAQLTPADAQQFEGLVNAIIDNGTQLESNTQAINNLNGNLQPQGFSSSAWTWFRQAIFTGMGDVLPQYTIPSFDTGGPVIRGGLARVHSGEYVTNPAAKGAHWPMQEGDINIEINEAGGEPDPSYIAKRMAFERRATRAAR